MRTVGLRIPSALWKGVLWYGEAVGHVRPDGEIDISETLRDLIARGLNSDRSSETGYRAGYAAGRSAGYADFMRGVAMAMSARGVHMK